jgi:hypothetical protein
MTREEYDNHLRIFGQVVRHRLDYSSLPQVPAKIEVSASGGSGGISSPADVEAMAVSYNIKENIKEMEMKMKEIQMSSKKIRYGKLKTREISERALIANATALRDLFGKKEVFIDSEKNRLIFTNGSLAEEDEYEVTPLTLQSMLVEEIESGNQKVFDWAVNNGLVVGGEEFVVVDDDI